LTTQVRVPRLNGKTMGALATRTPHRPCPIGLSVAQVMDAANDFSVQRSLLPHCMAIQTLLVHQGSSTPVTISCLTATSPGSGLIA